MKEKLNQLMIKGMIKAMCKAADLKDQGEKLKNDNRGASFVEYILLIVGIVLIVLVVVLIFGKSIARLFTKATDTLDAL